MKGFIVLIDCFLLYLLLLLRRRWAGWLNRMEPVIIFGCLTVVRLFGVFLLYLLLLRGRWAGWLNRMEPVSSFLSATSVRGGMRSKVQNLPELSPCFVFVFCLCVCLFVCFVFSFALSNISQRLNEKQSSQKLSPRLALNTFPPKSLRLNNLEHSYHGYSTKWQGQIKTSIPSSSQLLAKRRNWSTS